MHKGRWLLLVGIGLLLSVGRGAAPSNPSAPIRLTAALAKITIPMASPLLWAPIPSDRKGDSTPIVWVNGQPIPYEAWAFAVEPMHAAGVPNPAGEALALLIQNTLIQQEAQRQGMRARPEEVEAALAHMFAAAEQSPEAKALLQTLAQRQGLRPKDPAFRAMMAQALERSLPVAKLNEVLLRESGGDPCAAHRRRVALLKELWSRAEIRLASQGEALGLQVPPPEELPEVRNPPPGCEASR